jgi:nucleoside-diphosphate-sugar epimerase
MKILITGHRGFIGSYLIKKLDAIGIDLVEGNDILSCDLPEVDVVIHLAAQPGVVKSFEDPIETTRTNILGTVRLLKHYKNAKFIFASTGGAIQDEIPSPYGWSKYCAEGFVKLLHDNYVILRFANVYGKGSRSVADKFLKEDIVIYGDGSATRTYVHIDDLIRGIIMALDWPKGSYFFGSKQNYSVLDIAKATGKPYKFENWRKGELVHSSLKNTTIGWEPTIDVIDYIKQNICSQ